LLVEPCGWSCADEPLGVEPPDSELGFVVAGFVGLKKPLTLSANCVNTLFLGAVVLVVVSGVTLLPSLVTVLSVGPVSDWVDRGGSVFDVPESGGSCPLAGSSTSVACCSFGADFHYFTVFLWFCTSIHKVESYDSSE